MFFLVLRKIFNNKWLMSCLVIGLVLAVAMVSSIPLYTEGILQRMLLKELQANQLKNNVYPGRVTANSKIYSGNAPDQRMKAYRYFDRIYSQELPQKMGLPVNSFTKNLQLNYLTVYPADIDPFYVSKQNMSIICYEGYLDKIQILTGRMPQDSGEEGVIEVIVTPEANKIYNLMVGNDYTVADNTDRLENQVVRVVGIYSPIDPSDPWWFNIGDISSAYMLMDYDLFVSKFVQEQEVITSANWSYAFDYNEIIIEDIPSLVEVIDEQDDFIRMYSGLQVDIAFANTLKGYKVQEGQLRNMLWVLQAPILILLAFYIFMVSQLIVENDKNEIAVLKSRGMSSWQLFLKYLLQSTLLSGFSVVLGPLVGLAICQVLGASNGFMELVARKALPLRIGRASVSYALFTGLFTVIMMMIPAMRSGNTTVVEHKQKKARRWKAPFWQKMFLDVILLAFSLFGYNVYTTQNELRTIAQSYATGAATAQELAKEMPLDPLLFIISTMFVLGAGLLFLRLYPWIIRFISWAGRKFWPTPLHLTFVQVGRAGGMEQFLMLFLVLTMAIGIFNANSARTINQNIEDRAAYAIGADLRVQMLWPSTQKSYTVNSAVQPGSMQESTEDAGAAETILIYKEPPYEKLSQFEGIESSTRVLTLEANMYGPDIQRKQGTLMCVEPYSFGLTTWYRDGLLPNHINEYLNVMSEHPGTVVASKKLMERNNLKVGDAVYYTWGGQSELQGVIIAGVDYWPGVDVTANNGFFLIANFDYVRAQVSLIPYEIWYKKAPGVATQDIYDQMKAQDMDFTSFKDATTEIVERKNDPLLQGANGAMTMGFIVTMAVCIVGFIIYWILSIQNRTLQFGIFRAMGMSKSMVMLMLIFEQLLISGAAIIVGILIGGIMSQLFVPLLGLVYTSEQMVPPFMVVARRSDYYKIYLVVGIMMISGVSLLAGLVNRIKAAQAIKLGED